MNTESDTDSQQSGTQTMQTLARLRELILRGELPPGERIAELALADRLRVSRTPIRAALLRLSQEGLLESINERGYRVRSFTLTDIEDAIELRGTLEGLAARRAAERGATGEALERLRAAVADMNVLFRRRGFAQSEFQDYMIHNQQFHAALRDLNGSSVVQRELDRVQALPFASPNAFMALQASHEDLRDRLFIAQDQHQQVLEAIECREGARAESLMREHARLARRNLDTALGPQASTLHLVPGGALLQRYL